MIDGGFLSPRELLSLANIGGSECDELDKYSPNQPRAPAGQSDGGQWTRGDSGSPALEQDKTPRPGENQVGVLMPEGCEAEWNSAIDTCRKLLESPNPSRALTGGHTTVTGAREGLSVHVAAAIRCNGGDVCCNWTRNSVAYFEAAIRRLAINCLMSHRQVGIKRKSIQSLIGAQFFSTMKDDMPKRWQC